MIMAALCYLRNDAAVHVLVVPI